MITRLLTVSSATVLLASVAAMPAFAATLTSGATGVVQTTANAAGVSVSANPSVSGTVTGTTGTSGTGSTGASVQANVNTGTNVTTGTTGTAQTNTSGASDTSAMIFNSTDPSVLNYSASGSDAVTNSSMVQTQAQLNSYAEGTMHNDPNVQNVQLTGNSVSMSYKEPGRFLGFIPMSITANATVDQSGNVTVTYPWYHFLVATNDSNLKANLAASVQSTMQQDMNGSFSARMQADLMSDLYTAFHANSNS